jgi:3-dehydroquinate dehydratase-2
VHRWLLSWHVVKGKIGLINVLDIHNLGIVCIMKQMSNLLVLNGPNLNLLGTREPDQYGLVTLDTINTLLIERAEISNIKLTTFQSNSELELINCIHAALQENVNFIIINPAGFTHTSVALRDALLGVKIPFIEVHLSNVYAREDFRKHSYFSDVAVGVISGLGPIGYELALKAAIAYLSNQRS